ncbi:hypothetical protein [Flagellimonas flava]|uniref:Helix-turn-helix domain-containing protein n=1 Tax=Flagellimonas flava TaxID=570519 RepID=A0A1M5P7U7_9FLAO|nr:hypothetical protein [Allomuricauda flava]SHG97767.1 hypothetical protein SAMN04488116_3117 [Allomuricauda flava]
MEDNKRKGFVKIYRSLLDWEWYTEPNTTHLFLYCLIKANYQGKKWKGKLLKRGDFITSVEHISRDTGLSISKVRTSLGRLEKSGCICKKTTNKYTAIRVVNYKEYQDISEMPNNQTNVKKQSTDNEITTIKENKKFKEKINKEKRVSSLTNFEYLNKNYKEQMDAIFKRNALPNKQRQFCIAKFNEKRINNLDVDLFENYLTNWIRNLEKDGTMEEWRRKQYLLKQACDA